MARYELILRLYGAPWLTIISKTPPDPTKAMEGAKIPKESKIAPRRGAIHAPKQMRHGHYDFFVLGDSYQEDVNLRFLLGWP